MTDKKLSQFISKKEITIVDAMAMIDINTAGVLFIVDNEQKLIGCLTDGDIRRWLIKTGELTATVSLAMTHNPITIKENEIANATELMKNKSITALPVVDSNFKIIDIILKSDYIETEATVQNKALAEVPVVVMAGGKGTRLYPYTKILPKPLIPIGDTPIVERIMNYYTSYGMDKFYMTVNYKKEMIRSYFSDGEFPFEITYIEENKPLGTGGSLKLIDDKFDKPIFVTNCDALILTDYAKVYDFHNKNNAAITIVAAVKNTTIPYGVLHTKENGELSEMEEKPKLSYMINTGMYIVNPDIISLIPDNCMFHMTHLVDKARQLNMKVSVYPVSEDSFLDMGEFDEMQRMEEKLHIIKE